MHTPFMLVMAKNLLVKNEFKNIHKVTYNMSTFMYIFKTALPRGLQMWIAYLSLSHHAHGVRGENKKIT